GVTPPRACISPQSRPSPNWSPSDSVPSVPSVPTISYSSSNRSAWTSLDLRRYTEFLGHIGHGEDTLVLRPRRHRSSSRVAPRVTEVCRLTNRVGVSLGGGRPCAG